MCAYMLVEKIVVVRRRRVKEKKSFMSTLHSDVQDSSRTLKFTVSGAKDRVDKIENANIFAAKMGQKVVGVALAEGSVSLTSSKLSSDFGNTSRRPNSQDQELKSAAEIVNIALARHLDGVALESLKDDSQQPGPKESPKVTLDSKHNEECVGSTPPRTPTPLRANHEPEATQSNEGHQTPVSDLVVAVSFRSTPDIGQPAFPFSGAVFPLHFGCTIIGRGKLQCVQLGPDKLIEIPHNSVSKRHAKIYISLDGTVSITDMNSTNGTCVGSNIESIMQSLTSLEQNTAVSICGGDYVSFGVCVCRIIPERARTGRHHQTLDIGNFQPSAFALDQLRILKITMNLHRMVDEEGFSPIEMARVLSERVSGDNVSAGISGELLPAENAVSTQSVDEPSKQRPTSILKRQHSLSSGVKFDIKNISDDETEDPFQNHGATYDDIKVANSNSRLNRPSTSNFFEVRSELNSGNDAFMESEVGSLNLDTHTNEEVMRKMVLRLSQITKDLAQIQTVVLGRQIFDEQKETKTSRPQDGAVSLQRMGSTQVFSMEAQSFEDSSKVKLVRSESFNAPQIVDEASPQLRIIGSRTASNANSTLSSNEPKEIIHLDHESMSIEETEKQVLRSEFEQESIADLRRRKSMKEASLVVTTEIGTIRSMEKSAQEKRKDIRSRQLAIAIDRSSELNSKCYSFGVSSSGNKVRLHATALIHIFSFIDPIPGVFMIAGVNREMRSFCKNDDLFFNLNLGHEKLRGTHVHERVTDKIIADMVMHRFRQVKIVNLQGCPFVTDQSLKAFIGHCQNLEELNLGRLMDIGPQITDAGMQLLIPHCPTLRNLDLTWLDGLTDTAILSVADCCTRLESLDVPNLCQLTNACIARLGSSPSQTTLRNLNLCGCSYIGDAAAFVIAQKFVNMMTLNLAGCDRIGPESMVDLVSKLRLKSLNITGLYRLNDKCLIDMSTHVGDLIRLRMGFLRCTDEGVGSLVKGLKKVTQFDMRGISEVTDLTVVVICQNMNNLRVIDMRGCRNISISARLMLAAKLEKNAKLGEMRMTTAIYADGC